MADEGFKMFANKVTSLTKRSILEIILVVLCIGLAFKAEGFYSVDNILNVLRSISMQGIIAFGMTMVIIAGEIDLSVGSAVAFAGCFTAVVTKLLIGAGFYAPLAVTIAILVSIAVGFCTGCLTGLVRMRLGVPTFITTLAWMAVLRGIAFLITNGFPVTPFPDWYNFFGSGYLFGIPFPAVVFIIVFFLVLILMKYTSFGRAIYAVGGNMEAARLSGINVRKVKTLVMGIVGLFAALSGVMQSAEIMSGTATTATGWELEVIAAVIIGGTSLMGGVGKVRGTLVGVIFLGVLINGMTLLNISEYWQFVVRGILILSAVVINRTQTAKK
jgi:ribose/xylose/arabinose/galactoside ABC-type transport system permease subunit